MKKSTSIPKNIPLSLVPGVQFLNLSNLYIEQYHPNSIKLNPSNTDSFILNALAYSDSAIVSAINPSNHDQLKKRINFDISILSKSKYPPIKLIYLIDGKLSLSNNEIHSLNFSLSKHGYHVFIYPEKIIYESLILSLKSTSSPIGADSLKDYYSLFHNAAQVEESIIEEIFSLISSSEKDKIEIPSIDSKLLHLRSKIGENFIGENYRDVLNTYDIFWINKECVESFIKKNFHRYEGQLYSILSKIRNHFIKHPSNHKGIVDFPVNDPKYFDDLIPLILPSDKIGDPRYESAAKAIILFFFEYCDFGKKSKDDPETLFSKFDGNL